MSAVGVSGLDWTRWTGVWRILHGRSVYGEHVVLLREATMHALLLTPKS